MRTVQHVMRKGDFVSGVGGTIDDFTAEAIMKARQLLRKQNVHTDVLVSFEFNGVTIGVKANSDPDLIKRDYMRAIMHLMDPVVSPYPNPESNLDYISI